jgi:hypothetical protein
MRWAAAGRVARRLNFRITYYIKAGIESYIIIVLKKRLVQNPQHQQQKKRSPKSATVPQQSIPQ